MKRPRRSPIAAYACPCGARDEVREPAPREVDCWSCKRPRAMLRFIPVAYGALRSARRPTAEESARVGRLDDPPPFIPDEVKAKPAGRALTWRKNLGHRPPDVAGKRVRVKVAGEGGEPKEPRYANDLDPMAPPGWSADNDIWKIRGTPFDVVEWALVR